ncbi:MAG: sugar phosphate isomerase/epimerase family protein [Candidatus Sumerlaeota bacterium]
MRFGVNLLLFSDQVTDEVKARFGRVAEMGFDGVEIPIFEPGKIDVDGIRSAAEDAGLALTASGALPPNTRFYGEDAEARKAAEGYVRASVRVAAELGAPLICGPLYKAVGDCEMDTPLETQRAETAEAMRPLAGEAAEAGVTLALEPLNRFETNFMNTVEQGLDFCEKAGGNGIGLLLDTFHMHIEEKDSAAAIRAASEKNGIAHFHASENDRGIAGSGQVHWDAVADAVKEADYDGWVVLESFNQSNQAIKTAVSCWRPFYPSEEAFLQEGLAFVKKQFGEKS